MISSRLVRPLASFTVGRAPMVTPFSAFEQQRGPDGKFLPGPHTDDAKGGGRAKSAPTTADPAAAAAQTVYDQAVAAEPAITATVSGFAEANGGKMEGLDFRVKTLDSLTGKIGRDSAELGVAPDEAASAISDAVRYTAVFPEAHYGSAARATIDDMQSKGYDLRVKNYWQQGNPYMGITIAAKAPDGQKFELQFHTATSLAVKEGELHPIYEAQRVETNPSKSVALTAQMVGISEKIPIPDGVSGIGIAKFQGFSPPQPN